MFYHFKIQHWGLVLGTILIIVGLSNLFPIHRRKNGSDPILATINNKRSLLRLRPLEQTVDLTQFAQERSCYLYVNRVWSHDKFVEGTTTRNFNYQNLAENIIKDFLSNDQAVESFVNSPVHKETLLSKDYRYIGIGRCGSYMVNIFGK